MNQKKAMMERFEIKKKKKKKEGDDLKNLKKKEGGWKTPTRHR